MTTSASHTTTVRAVKIGDQDHTVLSSNDVWYRYLEAVANLFLAGEIDLTGLQMMSVRREVKRLDGVDQAARQLDNFIFNVWAAPSCPCDPFNKPCGHRESTENERRQYLAELMGIPYLEPLASTDDSEGV